MIKKLEKDFLINKILLKEFLTIPLYKEIIFSKTFKRLKNIAFLGAIDYRFSNHKRFYRYEHSINVALLAYYYAKLKNLRKIDTDYLVVAALLHDIGHPPLSHSAEFGFKEKFNMNHHKAGMEIIKGKNKIFKDEIKKIINKYNFDEEYIVKLLNKELDNEISFALNNPINVDTIDGICRTYVFKNYRQKYKLGFIYHPFRIVKALVCKDEEVLDSFWELKNRMYNEFIHSKENLLLDEITKFFIIKNEKIKKEEYFEDDKKFLLKYNFLNSKLNIEKIKFIKRKYFVKNTIIKNYDDFYKKYKVEKKEEIVSIYKCRKKEEKCLPIF